MSSTFKGCPEDEVIGGRAQDWPSVLAAGSDGGALAGSLAATECDSGGRRR